MMNYDEAFEWWLNQSDNKDFEVIRRANVDFGESQFVEIIWKHHEKGGKDRVYPRCGGGFEMVEMYD